MPHPHQAIARYAAILCATWTFLLAGSFAWFYVQEKAGVLDTVRAEALIAFQKDALFRKWVSSHGGVYVPITEASPPNPYLAHVPERDIETPSGRPLTLVNPAYMMRQVFELSEKERGFIKGHITSLNPLRKENIPDAWEEKALRAFERGETEVSEVQSMDGRDYLRMMRPFVVAEGCIKCHAAQGYQRGDIRGGISVSVPMWHFSKSVDRQVASTAGTCLFLWLLGVGVILFGARKLGAKARQLQDEFLVRRQAEATLEEYKYLLSEGQKMAHLGAFEYIAATGQTIWSEEEYRIYGLDPDGPSPDYERLLANCIHPEDRRQLHEVFSTAMRNHEVYELEHRIVRPDGTVRWVHDQARPYFGADGTLIRYIGTTLEITERKLSELDILRAKQDWELTFDAVPDLVTIIDNDRRVVRVNGAVAEHSGLSKEELIGRKCHDVMHCSTDPHEACPHAKMLRDGLVHTGQVEHLKGVFDVTVSPLYTDGKLTACVHVARDVTAQVKSENYRSLRQKLLIVLNEEANEHEALRRITRMVKETTGVDAVGIRYRRGGDFPYYCQDGFEPDFIQKENSLVARAENGGICLDGSGNASLECTCGLVLTGEAPPDSTKWTSGGSYWSNDTSPALQIPADQDARIHPRNECIHRGYASVALIPIRAKGEILGLLQLNDRGKGAFTREVIESLEAVAENIGEAMLRREAEEKLIASERFLRMLTNQLPGMVGYWDTELRCRFANTSYIEWFGRTPEQMLGITMLELMGPELFSKNEPHVRRALGGEPQHFERTLVKPDGEVGYTWAHYIPDFVDGEVRGFYVLVSDVTALKQAEEAMRLSENRLRYALDGTNDGLWDVQVRTGRTYLSPRGCRILGYHEDELEKVVKVWSDLVHPDDLALTEERLKAHVEGRTEIFEVEQRLLTKSGGWKWIHTRGKVVERDEDGTPLRITGTHADITEKKLLESQLHQAQKMESVGRLAGGIAHDFNNLLTVILGHAQIGLMAVDPTQAVHTNFDQIRKAAEKSAGLTRQLLAFARKQTISPEVLDLNEMVENMLEMLVRLVGEDVSVAWEPARTPCLVKMDPSQLDQILANLCVNARDAIRDVGEITIETTLHSFDQAHCDANAGFAPGSYVLLAVRDDGCGMDEETLSHVFEPFFTTKVQGKGTGLGLATVYGIVKQNNGFINIYSEPDKGTTFKIYLPRYQEDFHVKEPEAEAAQPARGRETVMVVEDDPNILTVAVILLEKLGYRVLAANTPQEAIELVGKHGGDLRLLLTDVVMPNMNGRDLAMAVTARCPAAAVLYMSGYTANVIEHHGVLDGGVHFLNKPFSPLDLAVKVREALDEKVK